MTADDKKVEAIINWLAKGGMVRIDDFDAPSISHAYSATAEEDEIILDISYSDEGEEYKFEFNKRAVLDARFDEHGACHLIDQNGDECVVSVYRLSVDRFPMEGAFAKKAHEAGISIVP